MSITRINIRKGSKASSISLDPVIMEFLAERHGSQEAALNWVRDIAVPLALEMEKERGSLSRCVQVVAIRHIASASMSS